MDSSWMYETRRIDPSLFTELAKFVETAKIHTTSKKTKAIYCPCHDCNNQILWKNLDTIRSHLIRRGFVANYKVWVFHGEAVAPSVTSSHNTSANQVCDDDQGILEGDTDDVVMDGVVNGYIEGDDGDIDGDDGAADDEDFLQEMLCHAEQELLFGSRNGLDNWEALQKASTDTLYEQSKGCAHTMTVMCFVLEMLL